MNYTPPIVMPDEIPLKQPTSILTLQAELLLAPNIETFLSERLKALEKLPLGNYLAVDSLRQLTKAEQLVWALGASVGEITYGIFRTIR